MRIGSASGPNPKERSGSGMLGEIEEEQPRPRDAPARKNSNDEEKKEELKTNIFNQCQQFSLAPEEPSQPPEEIIKVEQPTNKKQGYCKNFTEAPVEEERKASEKIPRKNSKQQPPEGDGWVRSQARRKSSNVTPKPPTRPPNINLNLSVDEIAKKFGLTSTYETLEGWKRLSRKELMNLLKYSSILAKD